MSGHLILGITQAPKRGIDGVVAHRPATSERAENEFIAAGNGLQLAQQLEGLLAGERNDVKLTHLHALAGDPPLGRLQIQLGPAGEPQLPRPNEEQRRELQGVAGDGIPRVTLDLAWSSCPLARAGIA